MHALDELRATSFQSLTGNRGIRAVPATQRLAETTEVLVGLELVMQLAEKFGRPVITWELPS